MFSSSPTKTCWRIQITGRQAAEDRIFAACLFDRACLRLYGKQKKKKVSLYASANPNRRTDRFHAVFK